MTSGRNELGDILNNRMNFGHRFIFRFAWFGLRGSQFFWSMFGNFSKCPESTKIILPNGFPLIISNKDWISRTIYQGTYERSLLHFLDSLSLNNLVIDVGANVGVTLWHALDKSPSTTSYLAIEPSTQCIQGLECVTSSLVQNGVTLTCAVGDTDEQKMMYGIENDLHSGGASLLSHPGIRGHSEMVEVRKLDSILLEYSKGSGVALLKIDTEGNESNVISGATELLKSGVVEMIILEVSPNFGDVTYLKYIHQILGDHYNWFLLDETHNFRRKPILRKISLQESLTLPIQWNLVVVRSDIFSGYQLSGHRFFRHL